MYGSMQRRFARIGLINMEGFRPGDFSENQETRAITYKGLK